MLLKLENWKRHLICWIYNDEFNFIFNAYSREWLIEWWVSHGGISVLQLKIERHLNNTDKCEMMLNLLCNMFACQPNCRVWTRTMLILLTRQFDTSIECTSHTHFHNRFEMISCVTWHGFPFSVCHTYWMEYHHEYVGWQEPHHIRLAIFY